MKRLFIIHGWGESPKEGWYPWLKKELESKNFQVDVLKMPNTDEPVIEEWVGFLKKQVKKPDKETYFVGHSIGCQTILRYLESLPEHVKIGGCILVAGWINLFPEPIEKEGGTEIAKPWLETPIQWGKILRHTKNFISIFSDNDYYVPLSDSKIFKEKLNAEIIIEHEKGHFSGSQDNTTELPIALGSLLEISK